MDGTARPVRFFSQLLLILMGIVILYLVVDFGRQVLDSHQLRADLRALEAQREAIYREQEAWGRQLIDSRSDAAVDAWARRQGMVKANEVSIAILTEDDEAMSAVPESSEPAQASVSSRLVWWDLFFGQR
jgi:cell division protein FtsB